VGEIGVPSPKVIEHDVFLTKKSLDHVLHDEQHFYLLFCQGTLTCTFNESSTKSLPPSIKSILKEFEDVFPIEGPIGLPPFREIENQFDFMTGASLPNRLT